MQKKVYTLGVTVNCVIFLTIFLKLCIKYILSTAKIFLNNFIYSDIFEKSINIYIFLI